MLKTSDVVAVTCNRSDSSIGMLNMDKLKLMKNDSILVGTTWLIIDINALNKLLQEGKFLGVGLDVEIQSNESRVPENMKKLKRVVLTPHFAFSTKESYQNRINVMLNNIEAYLNKKPINVVN